MKRSAIIFVCSLIMFSCKNESKNGKQLFTLLPSSYTHVDFINTLKETEQANIIEYLYFNNGGGVAAGDINNDGLIDLYFTSNQNSNKLFLNKGNLRFEDITEAAGVAGTGDWKTGVTMADVNGDGLLDIYVCQVGKYKSFNGKNQLFINQGNLKFKEEAHEYGLDFQGFSTQAAFFDYDNDGDLDMYLLNHSVHTSRSYGDVSLRLDRDSLAGDRLFRNDLVNGKRFFRDVTKDAGIYSSQIGYGLGINVCDINNDGNADIYVSNDFHEDDYLYLNNGDGTFTEKAADYFAHTSRSSMGNDVADINNDGLPDIVVLDMLPFDEKIRKQSGGEDDYELSQLKLKYGYGHQFVRNTLQLNLGGGMFSEIGLYSGIASTDWSWSPLLCDVDNDGWKDLFITNGIYRRANDLDYVKYLSSGVRNDASDKSLYEKMPLDPNISIMFRNNKDLTFRNMSDEWGINKRAFSNGSTYADLDNDGDLDLIVNNINSQAFIYRNNAEKRSDNNYLSVKTHGDGMNTEGIGSRVTIYSKGLNQMAEQFPTRGFLSAASDVLHFGLGTNNSVDSLIVRWPDKTEQILKNIAGNTTINLDIRNATTPLLKANSEKKGSLFESVTIPGLQFTHHEDNWVDYYREQLIPHSLSAEGPALAVADINGDGLDDLFVGGAKGQPSRIFIQQPDGSFRNSDSQIFIREAYLDVVAAAFFDADGDGDMDLYAVRGGNEFMTGNPILSDLLLINDGKGSFSKAELPLMSHNGSCVEPCDFDNDGDIDLFVGSRSIPGSYGLPPRQYLLENDGKGHFTDITERTHGLENIGMVTGAVWFDFDGDGDKDLAITGEWMNICLFRNDNGKFNEVTRSAGLANTSGWWNCLKAADIDGDGNIDLIAGNLGLNSMLKASRDEPVEMFVSDFDNNGTSDPVICSYQNGISYPFASLDELSAQISGLEKRFPKYSGFGGKTITDIFGKNAIDKALVRKAEMFGSSVFMNNGNGTFRQESLPPFTQFSPVRDILAEDIDKDGLKDLIIAGNDYEVRPSYGRYDASFGWFLRGDADHSFKTLLPVESGLAIKGDARRLAFIEIKGKPYLVAAVNNGELQVFRIPRTPRRIPLPSDIPSKKQSIRLYPG